MSKIKPQTRKVKLKTRKIKPQVQKVKHKTEKEPLYIKNPLGFIVPTFDPYDGVIIFTLEYKSIEQIVILNDLRSLFKKIFPIDTEIFELNELKALERLKIVCPDHYNRIFVKEQSILNIELVKKTYPEYYNFISTLTVNAITFEEVKEKYFSILYLLNKSISNLISMRERINIYNAEEGTVNEDERKAVTLFIANYVKQYDESGNIESEATIIEEEQIVLKAKKKLDDTTHRTEKFVWLKSQDALECLFEDLSENKYIKEYSKELLYQHFTIKSELKPLSETKDKPEYKRINWNSKNTNLVVLIFQLRLDGSIFFTGDRYHKMAFDHFDKDGNDLNMDSLKTAKSQITNKRSGYIDKPIFQELRNLIKRNKQS